jgi:hypothetical protein
MTALHRPLSRLELGVLREVQDYWGPQNTTSQVLFVESGDAVLFVVAPDGSSPVMVNLTNLGTWHADGTLTLATLRDWVKGPTASGSRDAAVTVMMPLLDEGVDVWRPVQAEMLPSGWYRIVSVNEQPDDEKWAFEIGDVVVCEERQLSGGTRLTVLRRRDGTI